MTPKAYSPLSIAFEHPKSSVPPAQAAPLTAGKAIAANRVALVSHRFIFDLPSWSWNARAGFTRRHEKGLLAARKAIKRRLNLLNRFEMLQNRCG